MTKVAETRIKYSTLPLNCMELPWIFAAIFGHSRCDILIYCLVCWCNTETDTFGQRNCTRDFVVESITVSISNGKPSQNEQLSFPEPSPSHAFSHAHTH